MNNMKNIKETSLIWNVSPRRIITLCNEGKIEGAKKEKGKWMIPLNAIKPIDARIKTGKYIKNVGDINNTSNASNIKLPLPIGISDYKLASTEYYYVDKTMMIKELIDEKTMVSLFTRPRRFGKTLTMDMIRTYFEKTDEDTSVYFKKMKIWQCGKKYTQLQGKYPVIFMTLKDVKHGTWNETFEDLKDVVTKEIKRHYNLIKKYDENNLSLDDQVLLEKYLNGSCSSLDIEKSLLNLSELLFKYYHHGAIIIIDEYDTPIQSGYLNGYYEKIISFMRNFLSCGLKDNKCLSFGFLTGILRVAKESIFSGLNNLTINSVLDNKYSSYFGFTKDEVVNMAIYYDKMDKMDEICEWYDGYRFGNTDIFNPWSVLNYFRNDCLPRTYWASSASNEIIGEILNEADKNIYDNLNRLMQGEAVTTFIDTRVIYPELKDNPLSIYSFLLVAGYLKIKQMKQGNNADFICDLTIPNKEIHYIYNKEILNKLKNIIPLASAISIENALIEKNESALGDYISKLLTESVSFYDTEKELFYHGLVLGLCATMNNEYHIWSNQESGSGRFDICLEPKNNNFPGIIIELKAIKSGNDEDLNLLAKEALKQINDKHYDEKLLTRGIKNIYKYGLAFCNKNVSIASE